MARVDDAAPPERDPWDDYAIRQIDSYLFAEEMRIEERGRTSIVCGLGGLVVCGGAFYRLVSGGGSLWDFAGIFVALIVVVASVTLLIQGRLKIRDLRRRQKLLETFGLKTIEWP